MRKSNNLRAHKQKIGLPPGSLVHTGTIKVAQPQLSMMVFDNTGSSEQPLMQIEDLPFTLPADSVVWINIHGVQRKDWMQSIGERFSLHGLVQEDILNTAQRPKVDEYSAYLFIVARLLSSEQSAHDAVVSEQVSFVLRENLLITWQERSSGIFQSVREHYRQANSPIARMGADYLLYTLLDSVVDRYFHVLEWLAEASEQLEERATQSPRPLTLLQIQTLKRETLAIRRVLWPMREMLNNVLHCENSLIQAHTRIYLRDVYDHVLQSIEAIDAQRETIASLQDTYMSCQSNRLNQEMRVLTVITTIFMPLSFIAGLYGMNFENMPELHWRWGYFAVLGLMLLIAGVMSLFFWRRNWLSRR